MTTGLADRVAVVSAAGTGFSRDAGRSRLALAVDAATAAIEQAGLRGTDIDGICARGVTAPMMQAALGIPGISYWSDATVGGFPQAFLQAVYAIHAGACRHALVVQSVVRLPYQSRAAAADPFRRLEYVEPPRLRGLTPAGDLMAGPVGYAAWAARYLHEYGCDREDFGLVAVNSRSNAVDNDHAVFRTPLTMEEYRRAPIVHAPFGLLDMDVPVDGAHAFVLTTADRAGSLTDRPVLVHAAAMGGIDRQLDQTAGLTQHGQHVVADALRARSDLWLADFNVVYTYDGFSWLTLMWLEALGWCGPGEAPKFLRDHWNDATNRVLIGGRVPVNTHGGSLSEGATQGSGHLHEAVVQLQGRAGTRQVTGATTALVVPGGIFHNPHGFVFRV